MKRAWMVGLVVLSLVTIRYPVWAQVASVTRTWTAPGDDGNVGTATLYHMRYRTVAPPADSVGRESWWQAATQVPNMPVPAVAGTTQSVTVAPVGGFTGGSTYYWVIRARDDAGNWSDWSNVYSHTVTLIDIIRPAPITDLR